MLIRELIKINSHQWREQERGISKPETETNFGKAERELIDEVVQRSNSPECLEKTNLP